MKAIKINTPVTLTSGIEIDSGALIVITESYTNLQEIREVQKGNKTIKTHLTSIGFKVYASQEAYDAKKVPVDVDGLPTAFQNLPIDLDSWDKSTPSDITIAEVTKKLLEKYAGKFEVIEL